MSSDIEVTFSTPVLSVPLVLFLVFLVMKLAGYITWSWIWVTSPLWIGLALFVLILIVVFYVFWIFD